MSTKAEIRAEVRASRRAGPPADEQALARQALAWVLQLSGPDRIASYESYGSEPGTQALNGALLAAGLTVLLPRVAGEVIEWGTAGSDYTTSSMGIREPVDTVELAPVRALLVPALAVTSRGARLGKGGGFYDRVLASLDGAVPVAAIVRDEDVLADLPMEAHDRSVEVIITPTRVVTCAR